MRKVTLSRENIIIVGSSHDKLEEIKTHLAGPFIYKQIYKYILSFENQLNSSNNLSFRQKIRTELMQLIFFQKGNCHPFRLQ